MFTKYRVAAALACAAIAIAVAGARDSLPSWQQFAEAGSKIEAALFREMPLPGGAMLSRRPPAEAKPLLDNLVHADPNNAELYSLRALEEEQQQDFDGAENDWKLYAVRAGDHAAAQLALADFYHRRARPKDEIAALGEIAKAPARADEQFIPAAQQQSWRAFERIFQVIGANGFSADISVKEYGAWIARHPRESTAYSKYFDYLLGQKKFAEAVELLAQYSRAFPKDSVFAVRARAQLEFRRGNNEQSLAVYDRAFQPLWPRELIDSYFGLLRQTESLRTFLDASRKALVDDPNDLNAATRIFFYYQQENKNDAALAAINEFRAHKESTHTAWSAADLYTLARILDDTHSYAEAARYYFALYNAPKPAESSAVPAGMPGDARQLALAGLANILLTAPEEPLRLGAGDLSFYKDVATIDSGPGFLNGILSLLFNSESPQDNFAQEQRRAIPYFHRARAAELIAQLEHDFPDARELPSLRARLISVYRGYAETDVVIRESKRFLTQFPAASERMEVSLELADAYARTHRAEDEFAVYDTLLAELATQAHHLPLARAQKPVAASEDTAPEYESPQTPTTTKNDYARVLDRYLARLVALKQLPQALEVLRHEVDHNPKDPGIYERLAQFLEQNQMDAQIEAVYRRAIEQFPDRSWYQKLARFYLREKRNSDLDALTQQVVKEFAGSELETYFREVGAPGNARLYLQLNLYANRRFPHDLMFVRNLLGAYGSAPTRDPSAWEALLRQHWFESDDLRNEFFDFLSRSGQIDRELAALNTIEPMIAAGRWDSAAQLNPAAVEFYAEAQLWQSHFEKAAPALGAESVVFAGDSDLGERATAVYRSLAYFDPRDTQVAVSAATRVAANDPTSRDALARIGDIYADRNLLADAAPYWNRMAEIEPGKAQSFTEAATVFWDYYEFSDALLVLNQGRKKLGDESLFGYEEGAIYETEHDYPAAIAEYVKASLAGANSTATARLLALARRPQLRTVIDAGTREIAGGENPASAAIRLRISILEAEGRKSEIAGFLLETLERVNTTDAAQELETIAQERALTTVEEKILEREASLTTDAVTSLQNRYRLAQSYESRKDIAAAQRVIEELYAQNPKILGVVRATVDFYWRNKMQPRAIEVLLQAERDSYPELQTKFTFEAARKSTESGDYAQARTLIGWLLEKSPYDAEFIAAAADVFSREGDTGGLRDFYLARIGLMEKAALSRDERVERIAALRRGLIPALTRLKDYQGAVDQYIELLKSYPDDAGLSTEAARYAGDHAVRDRLVHFYAKAVADSPRDARWPIVLARIESAMEDYPSAIESYSKAIAIRPDRTDLHAARADLLERFGRDTDAAAEYSQLYTLTYHDSQWMLKLAEVRARHGDVQATIDALKAAMIEGRPDNAANYFAVAKKLEDWNMLEAARGFAEQGVTKAGDNLLAEIEHHADAQTYIRIMTRLRKQAEAIAALAKAREAAPGSAAATLVKQVEAQGLGSVSDSQWRAREQQVRRTAATAGMKLAAKTAGETVARYFTPEEKIAFEQFLKQQSAGATREDREEIWLGAAESAGFAALETEWRYQLIISAPLAKNINFQALVDLQDRRMQFSELGKQLEEIFAVVPRREKAGLLYSAADAYRTAGDWKLELLVLSALEGIETLNGDYEQHFFALLLAHDPDRLVSIARTGGPARRNAAANFALANAPWEIVQKVIAARSTSEEAIWPRAYVALAGLYFGGDQPDVNDAFVGALNPKRIGELVGTQGAGAKPEERSAPLAGSLWFYYGSRYGEYLGATHQKQFNDYVPAQLEAAPGNADAYAAAAEDYAEFGDYPRAIADFGHALELDPRRAFFHVGLARTYWKQNEKERAIAEWKLGIGALTNEVGRGALREAFWTDFATLAEDLRKRAIAEQFKPELETFLRAYIGRNSTFRNSALLIAVYSAMNHRPETIGWFVQLASSDKSPEGYLADLAASPWIPPADRAPIYEHLVSMVQTHADLLQGDERAGALGDARNFRWQWLASLIDAKQFARAAEVLAGSVLASEKLSGDRELDGVSTREYMRDRVEIAAGLGRLPAVLDELRAKPEAAPSSQELLQVAETLERMKLHAASRELLEYAYTQAIEMHELTAPNFLGLAEIRLREEKVQEGTALLKRLTLVVGEPNENLDAAAALLEKTGHNGDAMPFLERLVAAQPWNFDARVRLGKDRVATKHLEIEARDELRSLARDSNITYRLRADAAMGTAGGAAAVENLGSDELDRLASSSQISAADVNHEFFDLSRQQAARTSNDPKLKIALLGAVLREVSGDDSPRIPLFFALVESGEYSLAISDAEPMIRTGLLASLPSESDGEEGPMTQPVDQTFPGDAPIATCSDADEDDQASASGACAETPMPAISIREQEQLAEKLSASYEHIGDLALATNYLQIVLQLETNAKHRATLRESIARLRDESARRDADAARRPIIHSSLEQDRIVRLRIPPYIGEPAKQSQPEERNHP